jgi:orotidine-5'-phosphate decarboxylase
MGEDSVRPFLEYDDKWAIVLGLTSNTGAKDFELQRFDTKTDLLDEGIHIEKHGTKFLYEMVLEKVSKWGTTNNLMFVIGATQADEFVNIRRLTPEHFYLVPGVGAQGGSLKEISEKAMLKDCGILVNASRAIIYASDKENFADVARVVAKQCQSEMAFYLPS